MPARTLHVPRDLSRDVRDLLESLVEESQRRQDSLNDLGEAVADLDDRIGSDGEPSKVGFAQTQKAGDITRIPPGKRGSILVLNLTQDATLKTTGNLKLAGEAASTGASDTIVLISDGQNWIELGRSGAGMGNTFGCPVIIQGDCDGALQLLETDGTVALKFDLDAVGLGNLTIKGHLVPKNELGLIKQDLGIDTTNLWRYVYAEGFRGEHLHLSAVTRTISSSPQDDYDLSAGGDSMIYRLNPSQATSITGIVPFGSAGRQPFVDIINVNATNTITLQHQDAGSSAANRIITGPAASPYPISASDTARMWYDNTTQRWRVLK